MAQEPVLLDRQVLRVLLERLVLLVLLERQVLLVLLEPPRTATRSGESSCRDTTGSGNASLRGGPCLSTTPPCAAPLGVGSLQILVTSGGSGVSFGNEVDFQGTTVAGLTTVGYRVFRTDATKMPSIRFEVDPNVPGINVDFSRLEWTPTLSPANTWSGYLNATTSGTWRLTAPEFDAGTCGTAGCTFAEMKAFLPDAVISTVAVAQGLGDGAFHGAVDDLRINSNRYNFEPLGVLVTP